MGFKMPPHVFHRIELRGVGRQALHSQVSLGRFDIAPNQCAAVDRGSIPENHDFAREMPLEMAQERDDLRALDAPGVDLEIKAPQGQAADDRKAFPVEGLLQEGRLPARGPGAGARGPGAQPAFVNEDNGPAFFAGLFFKAGQTVRFHCAMAFSSRSMARRSGRWQLKPLAPSKRQTWPG